MAVCLHDGVPTPHQGNLQLPLALFLSPRIPAHRANAFRDLIKTQTRYARLTDSEDGALHVLLDFELEELAALEKQKRRVVGLPFAERLLSDPGVLSKVEALPLFDLIYRSPGSICFSGLSQNDRIRCHALAKWIGARQTQDLGPGVELLIATRVSLHPDSKYQAALKSRLPIAKPSFLQATWDAKRQVEIERHILPALAGLPICFGPRQGEIMEKFKSRAASEGAIIECFDKAEVVIVSDTSKPIYQDARKLGMLVAPPLWLERSLQLRCCLPIAGDLEVPLPGVQSGGNLESADSKCGTSLLNCVLCLLYLQQDRARDAAKTLAWRCGALTTLDPNDKAISHVLFNVLPDTVVHVSVPVDEDKVCFLDVSWLEACASADKKVDESQHPKQRVVFNPTCDAAHAAVISRMGGDSSGKLGRGPPKLGRKASVVVDDAAFIKKETLVHPVTDAVQHVTASPSCTTGIFAGMVLGLVGWPHGDVEEKQLVDAICNHGGTTLHSFGDSPGSVLSTKFDVCICRGNGPPPFQVTTDTTSVALATPHWILACIADKTLHTRSSFPHFEPAKGPLPLDGMSACSIRVTGMEVSRESHRRRARLEELIQVLGAKVANPQSKISEITHLVCVVPDLLEGRLAESARKRQIPLISMHWLLDCFRMTTRLPEERYAISRGSDAGTAKEILGVAPAIGSSFGATVLSTSDILISPSALGCLPRLPQMAEELGAASVHTWRDMQELSKLIGTSSLKATDGSRQTVVLVEKEEACGGELHGFLQELPPETQGVFVQPSWLTETYSQRRRLPLDSFAAFPNIEPESQASKRPRISAEASYAWQPAEMKRLEEVSEQARTREMQSKALQKVNEGLRLAELRRQPSRSMST